MCLIYGCPAELASLLCVPVSVTKNRCVTHVKIRGYANFVSSLLAYLISAVASWFSNSILSGFRMLLQIVCIVILLYLVQPESSRTFRR